MKEILLDDWDELVATFDSLPAEDWLFRGHLDSKWDLKTSLERHTPSDIPASRAEASLLREFKRRAHTYLPPHHMPAEESAGEWLALMQHFGAPTRLLDATRSPYVATYFAVEDAKEGTEFCAVWAIDRRWCLEAAGEAVLKEQPERRAAIETAIQAADLKGTPAALLQGYESSLLKGDKWRGKKTTIVVPFVPERLSERLSVQQGEFLLPRNVDAPFMENLSALGESGDHVIRYLIPTAGRGRILERLRVINITRAQLFPGLDGYAQSFRSFLVKEPPEERLRRVLERQALDGLREAGPELESQS